MAIDIIFDKAIDRRASVRYGPFPQVTLSHRKLRAGEALFIRNFDGGWHIGEGSFLEVRVEPAAVEPRGMIRIDFVRPYAMATPSERASSVRLYGDRLLGAGGGEWIASDEDDGRCWVAETTGLANREVVLTAA